MADLNAAVITQLNNIQAKTGKTIAELCDMEQVAGWFPPVRAELQRRFPEATIVPWEEFGLTHGPYEHEVVEALPGKLREQRVDLVISAVGR